MKIKITGTSERKPTEWFLDPTIDALYLRGEGGFCICNGKIQRANYGGEVAKVFETSNRYQRIYEGDKVEIQF